MENSKKDLTQGIIPSEQFVTTIQEMVKGQAEIQEMLKQFLIGQNTGAKAVVDDCEMNEDCVDNTGAKTVVDVPNWELNEATLCFRVGGKVCNTNFVGIEVVQWFAIDKKGISPYIEEPQCDGGCNYTPLAIGPYIFLISDVKTVSGWSSNSETFRAVHYLKMQNVNEEANPWKKASSLIGEDARSSHFLAANDMIYAFGFINNGNTLRVCYIPYGNPNQAWSFLESPDKVEPCSSTGPLKPFCFDPASTIEFEFVTTDGKPSRHARRAFIFSKKSLLSYDFETNKYELFELSEIFFNKEIRCSHCPDGGFFYLLIRDSHGSFSLVVYDHHDKEMGYSQVFGLDDYLPENDKLRLVHLGNELLCLLWPLELGFNIKVQCIKFTVELLCGKHRATNVSSRVYTVEGLSSDNFEAVVVSRNESISEIAEDNALGLGAPLGELNTGANSDAQISK